MRPWLFQFGPLVLPTDARDELCRTATGISGEEYVDKVWEARDEAFGAVPKSHRRHWPFKRLETVTAKVTRLPVRLRVQP